MKILLDKCQEITLAPPFFPSPGAHPMYKSLICPRNPNQVNNNFAFRAVISSRILYMNLFLKTGNSSNTRQYNITQHGSNWGKPSAFLAPITHLTNLDNTIFSQVLNKFIYKIWPSSFSIII